MDDVRKRKHLSKKKKQCLNIIKWRKIPNIDFKQTGSAHRKQ